MNECIFCTRKDQPPALFETDRLYVMPDKYPLCPGHTLVICKNHYACYGAAPVEVERELEEAVSTTRSFLTSAYGKPLLTWENGVSGQTVFHAHLHLMPLQIDGLPADLDNHPDVTPVQSWEAIREHFDRHGNYRFLEVGGQRRLLIGHSPALRTIVEFLARATGLAYGRSGWVRTSTPVDVAEVSRLFQSWQAKLSVTES